MGIRETVNKQPFLYGSIAAAVFAFGLAFIAWHTFRSRPGIPTKDFFSDDDGQTWFVDSAGNVPPFDHNGKPAYRAHLFKCSDGKTFISYLERFNKEAMTKAMANGPAAPSQGKFWEVKRPGDPDWISISNSAAYVKATQPVCPGGQSEQPIPVLAEGE